MSDTDKIVDPLAVPEDGPGFYKSYEVPEDTVRSAYHYEQDAEFYFTQTGGKWNVYSCLLWEDHFTDITQAQEKKLDKLAEMMQLKPGMHILDVGCGWGGPLTYLCEKYGVTGMGIAVAQPQIDAARERAARHGVGAQFELMHWENMPEVEQFDAIYSDEVIVHFNDLSGFFRKCNTVLRQGGVMAHKELHLSHSKYAEISPMGHEIIRVFGYTGNYVPLYKELMWLEDNGFQIKNVIEIPMSHYYRTLDTWMSNLFNARERMIELTGKEWYMKYRLYLKGVRHIFTVTEEYQLHIIASRKM